LRDGSLDWLDWLDYTDYLMRLLAVDLGAKNIGIAISDGLGITVRPVETIRRASLKSVIERLKFLITDLEAEAVVIGLPLKLDGQTGEAAEAVLRFAERLKGEIDLPIFTQDERLTSYEAEQLMIERGWSRKERKARSDEIAAVIILQDYLSRTTKS
jgi:putative Holliday junction resolvase